MEKRKLAKIPREEASDEMVRFAERAAGTHIVTTRDIEKDLLMVTFYPIGKLKKGEKGAQLRTFFSKNDYISQDLTSERVKWLTAAFDRMECIHLYEYHWDRDKGNRYTPNMFFWTDADIDEVFSEEEISLEQSSDDANTPIEELKQYHYNAIVKDYEGLGKFARIVLKSLNNHKRFKGKEVKTKLQDMLNKHEIEKDMISEKLYEKIS